MAVQRLEILAGLFDDHVGDEDAIDAGLFRGGAEIFQPEAKDGIVVGEDDEAGAGVAAMRSPAARASTSCRRVPFFTARSLARWITGPSARGSLKGTPSSSTSAPASIAASGDVVGGLEVGIADGDVGNEAGFAGETGSASSLLSGKLQLARQDAHVLVAAAGDVDDDDVARRHVSAQRGCIRRRRARFRARG